MKTEQAKNLTDPAPERLGMALRLYDAWATAFPRMGWDTPSADAGQTTRYVVAMHPSIRKLLAALFDARLDGIAAIEQLHADLPRIHRPARGIRCWPWLFGGLYVYEGRFEWFDAGFSYVEVGETLHILDIWVGSPYSIHRRKLFDVVLPRICRGDCPATPSSSEVL